MVPLLVDLIWPISPFKKTGFIDQEKFRKLEEKEKKGDDFRGKKIHVRSKDPGKIARQFEKGDKEDDRPRRKVT